MPKVSKSAVKRQPKTAASAAAVVEGNRDDAQYDAFLARLQARFIATTNGAPLFETDATGLFAAYLDAFPAADRQHHTCHACRKFVERFGGLVTIDAQGQTAPAIWHEDAADGLYAPAIAAMAKLVRKAKVTGVFLASDTVWGQPLTGIWRHMAVTPPAARVYRRGALTAGQAMAAKREDFGTVQRALADFGLPLLEQAVTLLSSDTAYRGDRVLGPAQWLRDLQQAKAAAPSALRNNVVWRAIATAPDGFCHPRSSVIGSVLEDLAGGLAAADVLARFNDKMRPSQYQRALAAPTAGAIQQAEKLFADLGLAPALPRRYAQMSDIPATGFIWTPPQSAAQTTAAGVFGHIAAKDVPPTAPLELPTVTMTWAKFQRDVLPTARKVEARVPSNADRFMALVTAANADAPPILQWDRDESRNQVSWYYASGIDAEIRRRVVAAGGQHADVDIRASLIWNNYNDLDLHVQAPDGYVWFADKRPSGCRGWLDVDANAGGPSTCTPVENTRWQKGYAPAGRYKVWVHHYATHDHRAGARSPFIVELEIFGEVLRFDGETSRVGDRVEIATFVYTHGLPLRHESTTRRAVPTSTPNAWGVTPGAFVPVRAFVHSPNLWGEPAMAHHGRHVFALLDGCRDTAQGIGRGFFTETLRSDLRPVRSVLEAYAATATIASDGIVPACGLGFSDQAPWNLTVRVMSPGGVGHYTLDRWD
jgi:hypothetical protein